MSDDDVTGVLQGGPDPGEAHFRALYDNSMDAIILAEPDGSIVSANPAACALFGLSEATLRRVGRKGILDEDDPAMHALIALRRQTGRARGEVRAWRAGGVGFIAEISSVIFRNAAGEERISATLRDVTERRRVQDELRARDRLLRITCQAARVGGWEADLRSRLVTWSDEVCRIHGVPAGTSVPLEEAIQYYTPECRDRLRAAMSACARDGVPYDEEFEITAASGERVSVRAIGYAVHDRAGVVTHVQGAFQDISERKRAEYELIESRQRFQQFGDAMPMIVWTAEADGTVDYANRAFSRYVALGNDDEPPAQRWLNAVYPDDRPHCVAAWEQAVATGAPYSVEFRIRHQCEQLDRWHLVSAVPIRDDSGRIVKWYGTAVDIHDRRLAEDTATALADRLRTTLESITDAFFTLDGDWRFTYINRQAERLLQRGREELIGKMFWSEFREAVGMSFDVEYHRAVREQQAVHFEEFYPPLGVWVEAHAYPSADGLAVYLRDVSERRALEDQLRQAQRLEAVGQLTGGVAHDFNNLLTVVLGGADVLVEQLADHPALQELAGVIRTTAERGSALTRRLLAFGRRQTLAPRVVDLNQLVEGLDDLLRRTLSETIDLDVRTAPDVWPAFIDSAELEAALLNLCINARDAMNRVGRLTIETANVHLDEAYANRHEEVIAGEYVLLAVSDTGTGIPRDIIGKVFDPFFTTKETGKGSGLGLSMVYGFVKQSQGHIKIYSEVGQGTTVKLYLPRAGQVDALPAAPQEQAGEVGDRPVAATVLVVEDDEFVRRHAETLLADLGYGVVAADDGPGALELIRQRSDIDLLFTDVIMPGMNGRQLVEAARALRPTLEVLFTSGYTENAIVHQGRLDPGVNLLQKPYRKADLAAKLRQILSGGGDAANRDEADE